MTTIVIPVPRRLLLEATIKFAQELLNIPEADEYIFDFSRTGRIEPFALIFLSSELQRFRVNRSSSTHRVRGIESCTYAANMGFFKAFGVDYGKRPGEAKGSNTYIPITIFDAEAFRTGASENFEQVGEFIEKKAQEMSTVLCRVDSGNLFETLTYSIREIIRNVIEHSNTKKFGLCAQYWPTYHLVELSIIDRGIGIKDSLNSNKALEISSDREALNFSLMPGVSSKAVVSKNRKHYDVWANSGFGLYLTSRLCREGGSFFIASGTSGLYLSESKRRYLDTPFQGTALKLTLCTDRISSLYERLEKYRNEADKPVDKYTASLASHLLMKDFKQ